MRVLEDPKTSSSTTISSSTTDSSSTDSLPHGLNVVSMVTAGVVVRAVVGAALRRHLQVGPGAVVASAGHVAEVDDAALVRPLVPRPHCREAELVGDVATGNLHHLPQRVRERERERAR